MLILGSFEEDLASSKADKDLDKGPTPKPPAEKVYQRLNLLRSSIKSRGRNWRI